MLNAYSPVLPADTVDPMVVPAGLSLAPKASPGLAGHITDPTGLAAYRPVSSSKVLLTANQLAVMTQNGIEIAEALDSVATSCLDPRLKASMQRISEAVSGGSSLSAAVASYGVFFPPTLAPMLSAAEATGEVPQTLNKICARMRGEMQMRGTIVGAMIYPFILIGASLVVMSALIIGVLPQFSKVFVSIGKPIPPSTAALLSFGSFCRESWPLILIGLLGGGITLFMLRRSPIILRPIAKFLMYGPMIRGAYRPLQAGRNFRTLAAIIGGGVPLLQAVQLTRRTTRDLYWMDLLDSVEQDLIDGRRVNESFREADFLPPEAAQMVITAEKTGRVAEVLEDIGQFYEEEAARRIKRLITAFEPVIILCMGVVVAGIVMSVMLPLLDVSTAQR